MDEEPFWKLVDQVKGVGTSERARVRELQRRLGELPLDEVVSFDVTFRDLRHRLNTWDLWGAAYVINGGCSDDGFIDFRSWVISEGRGTYARALTDPESLLAVLPARRGARRLLGRTLSLGAELYAYAAGEVYEQRTGEEIYGAHPESDGDTTDNREPRGEPFDEDTDALKKRYPRLAAAFLR